MGRRVDPHSSSDEAHGHRQFDRSHQIATIILLPVSKRAIDPLVGSVAVGPRLYCSPVLSTCDCYGGDCIHDSLVVSGCAERVGLGEVIGLQHPVNHLGALGSITLVGHLLRSENRTHPSEPVHSQIADYSQYHGPAGQSLYFRCDCLGHGVDSVGAHGVSAVYEDVYYHHRAGFGFDDSGLDVPAATAELDKNWVHGVA